jgi:hypothetical protein
MAQSWVATPGVLNLRRQFDEAFPDRDHASDGTIGDLAHQLESASSHNPDLTGNAEWEDGDRKNEVRALDVDSDLRYQGVTMQTVVDHLRALPGLSSVIRYMIFNRVIYRASDGWAGKPYTGSSPHTEHAHFTMAFTQAADENTTFDYRLEELTMPTADEIATAVQAKFRNSLDDLSDSERNRLTAVVDAKLAPRFAAVLAAVSAMAGKDFTDEAAIVAAVLAGLTPAKMGAAMAAAGFTPQAIAAMIPEDLAASVADELAKRMAS